MSEGTCGSCGGDYQLYASSTMTSPYGGQDAIARLGITSYSRNKWRILRCECGRLEWYINPPQIE